MSAESAHLFPQTREDLFGFFDVELEIVERQGDPFVLNTLELLTATESKRLVQP